MRWDRMGWDEMEVVMLEKGVEMGIEQDRWGWNGEVRDGAGWRWHVWEWR